MNVTLTIPDSMAARLVAEGGDLERQALEALMVDAFRGGRVTRTELQQALGSATPDEIDRVLTAHGIVEAADELGRDGRAAQPRSPAEAAARMRRSRVGNRLPEGTTLHDLMAHGRA